MRGYKQVGGEISGDNRFNTGLDTRTRPSRCSLPLPSFARFMLARIVSFLWNLPVFML